MVRSARPPAIPSIAVSPVATTYTTATAPVKPLSPHEVQQVEGMIERCLHLYMNQEEVIMALQIQANIAPTITRHGACVCSFTARTPWPMPSHRACRVVCGVCVSCRVCCD